MTFGAVWCVWATNVRSAVGLTIAASICRCSAAGVDGEAVAAVGSC